MFYTARTVLINTTEKVFFWYSFSHNYGKGCQLKCFLIGKVKWKNEPCNQFFTEENLWILGEGVWRKNVFKRHLGFAKLNSFSYC